MARQATKTLFTLVLATMEPCFQSRSLAGGRTGLNLLPDVEDISEMQKCALKYDIFLQPSRLHTCSRCEISRQHLSRLLD